MNDKLITTQKMTNQKVVLEPFVLWSRTDSASTRMYEEGQDRTLSESYQVLNGNQLDMFMRFSSAEEVSAGKDMTLEDLMLEITGGDVLEIKEGIPKLAYSEMPVSVTLWVDENTYELKKVMIDETAVMQAYMEKEMPKISSDFKDTEVSKAILFYEIGSIDKITKIPFPD